MAEIFHNCNLSLDFISDVHVPLVSRPTVRKREDRSEDEGEDRILGDHLHGIVFVRHLIAH